MLITNVQFARTNLSVLEDALSASLEIGQSVVSMKILMRPIEMIAWFSKDGVPNPVRYADHWLSIPSCP